MHPRPPAPADPRPHRTSAWLTKAGALMLAMTFALAACVPGSDNETDEDGGSEAEMTLREGEAVNGTRLMDDVAMYPRVIRAEHGEAEGTILASAVTFDDDGGHGAIFESTDDGRSFEQISTVSDPGASDGLCCSTLYELPQQVGELPAGTLLWSGSVGQEADDPRMTLPIWASDDGGHTWEHLATVATSENSGGLWEPEFTVAKDGKLVMFAADETQQPEHSQTLVMSESEDGIEWSERRNVVAAEDPELRPGMPVVRTLPDGTYLMSYEICGMDCRHFTRSSTDGIDWGDPEDLGEPLESADGTHFRHAQNISWYDDGSDTGRMLTIGQVLNDADGQVAPGSGQTMFVSDDPPEGEWQSAEAPLHINEPWDDPCPNYTSSLLPMPERDEVLELATGYDENDVCTTYFAVGDLP